MYKIVGYFFKNYEEKCLFKLRVMFVMKRFRVCIGTVFSWVGGVFVYLWFFFSGYVFISWFYYSFFRWGLGRICG